MKRRKQSKKKIKQLRALVENLEHLMPTDPPSQGERNSKQTGIHFSPDLVTLLNESNKSFEGTKAKLFKDALEMFRLIDSQRLSPRSVFTVDRAAEDAFIAHLLGSYLYQHHRKYLNRKFPKPKLVTKPGNPLVIAEKQIPIKHRLTNEELNILIAFLTLLIAIWQLVQSNQPTEIAQSQINQLIRAYEHVVMEAKRNPPIDIHYSVVRPVALKVKPIHHSTTVKLLLPNQPLLMIQKKHKWIYVEYLDSNTEVTYYGWVDKKYLRRMKVSPTD